jgi:hypothetical protein
MFARDDTGGALYYYTATDLENLAYGTPATPVQIAASGYSAATYPVLQAADLDHDGTPDLRTLTASGTAVPQLFDGTALTAQTAQALTVPNHAWPLTDGADGTASTAADTIGTLALANSGTGTSWDTDDTRDNVLDFDGTGSMSTSAVLSMSAPFTVSLWAKPTAVGGVIASQDGTTNSGFLLYSQGNSEWSFCMAVSDTTRNYNCIVGGHALIGQWSHLTATYDPATKVTALYVDGRPVARGSHTAVSGFTGDFHLGDEIKNGVRTGNYQGSVSDVQAWNGTALTEDQVTAMANLHPASAPYTFADTADYDGNGDPDVVAADSAGDLWLYRGDGTGHFVSGHLYLGGGFTGYTFAGVADFNGDGYADIVALAPGGTLRLYPGDSAHDLLTPSIPFVSVWKGYAFVGVGDFDKDGKADIVGRHPDGTLYLYPGTGTGATLSPRVQIGTGWTNYTFAGLTDINEDGNLDVVARDSNGALWNYPGNGSDDVGTRVQIGSSWSSYTFAGFSDFNGDGHPDLTVRDSSGYLWLYPRTATGFSPRVEIGHSW